ncbi:hypothetical protein [Alteromonas sp. a30]|uniref:hypothetical protein n=1 Tax=Alteromonas sp. a30 TaxID=2730917 RepID=UPI00227FAF15|nr:hypothetical protein [Alteromonas sp. a30]MCY7296518.1 hypothetical protein [Alteromonas sp. a30]
MPDAIPTSGDSVINKVSVNTSIENEAPSASQNASSSSSNEGVAALQKEMQTLRQKVEEMACCSAPFDDELSHYLSEQFNAQNMLKRP